MLTQGRSREVSGELKETAGIDNLGGVEANPVSAPKINKAARATNLIARVKRKGVIPKTK